MSVDKCPWPIVSWPNVSWPNASWPNVSWPNAFQPIEVEPIYVYLTSVSSFKQTFHVNTLKPIGDHALKGKLNRTKLPKCPSSKLLGLKGNRRNSSKINNKLWSLILFYLNKLLLINWVYYWRSKSKTLKHYNCFQRWLK